MTHQYQIHRGSTLITTVTPTGTRQEAVMGVDVVSMSFTSVEYIELLKGDTILINGQTFKLSKPSSFERDRKWNYNLQFFAKGYDLVDAKMFGLDENNNLTEYDCFFTGTASAALDLILLNANRVSPGWVKGTFDETETFDFDFTGDTCSTALTKLADTCKTEFWYEGNIIHLTKKGEDSGLSFRHGKGKGLTKLIRKNTETKVVTRLHVRGSKQNLPTTYPGLSKRLRMPSGQLYIEDPAKVAQYGLTEDTLTLEDVFPRRTGTVTAVANELTFTDAALDFDLNTHLVDGVSAKVKFITGQVAGYTFEIRERGYNHATKTITINVNKNEQAMVVPSATGLRPQVGDKYILIDVIMPAVDIANAEAELLTRGQEAYAAVSDPVVQYEALTDRRYLRFYDIAIKLGSYVNIAEPEAGIDRDIRVISKTTNLQDPYDVTLELADTVAVNSTVSQIITERDIQKAISNTKITDIARQRMNWRTTAELATMLDTLRGEMLLIMGEGGAYTTDIVVRYNVNTFQSSAGIVTHSEYIETGGIWNVSALNATIPTNAAYYFYIKASKTSQAASMVFSTAKIGVNDVTGFYHFPFGILSSMVDGQRLFSSTKGYTQITGGNIKTGRIVSTDGLTWFDLDAGEFRGKFTFSNGEDVRESLESYADMVMNDAYEETIEYVNTIRDNIQNQLDGVIESYFDDYEPTLANYPASSWTTIEQKDEHLGDTFTNDSTGLSYRWTLESGNYFWKQIADTGALLALQKAQKAQDTADGKRRTFLIQPVGPYDRGDMWMTGADILVATTDRPTGSYIAGDWVKLDKYTDDSAVNNLQIGGRNLILNSKINFHNSVSYGNLSLSEQIESGQVYTISARMYSLTGGSMPIIVKNLAWSYEEYRWSVGGQINEWQVFSTTFTSTRTDDMNVGIFVDAGFWHVDWIKLEKGNKATDWTPAPEDVEEDATSKANAAKQQAIDSAKLYADTQIQQQDALTRAYADGIVSDAEQLAINEAAAALAAAKLDATQKAGAVDAKIGDLPSGKTIIVGGKISTDLILTDTLIAKQVQTQGVNNISLNQNEDNLLRFRHSNGVVGIEMGIVSGKLKLVFYDETGTQVWEGGEAGIKYVTNIPESWSAAQPFTYLGNWSYPLNSSDETDLKSMIDNVTSITGTQNQNISVSGSVNLFLYDAGKNNDAGINEQYNGYHTAQYKSTANFAATGWWLFASKQSFTPEGQNMYTVSVMNINIEGGARVIRNVFISNVIIYGPI